MLPSKKVVSSSLSDLDSKDLILFLEMSEIFQEIVRLHISYESEVMH